MMYKKKAGAVSFLIMLILFTVSAFAQTCTEWGPYVNTPPFKGKGVLMMADVMMPANGLAPYTYACSVQFSIGKSGGYCGIQLAGEDEKDRKPNNIFSIWDFPNKVQLIASYKDPLTFVGGFGGEGTGLHSHADFGWVPGQWYTNVVRCWSTNDSTTNVGYWIFDQSNGTWKHYVTFVVPEAHALLHGNIGSFLENFADDKKRTRLGTYKSYWMLQQDGAWQHPDSLFASAGKGAWKADAFDNDGVQLTSCGADTNVPSHYSFAIAMPSAPAILEKASVYDCGSYYDKKHSKIYVDWSVLPSSTPQLSYKLALYDNAQCSGSPIAEYGGTDPDITYISLPVKNIKLKNQSYFVTLQLTDIFQQQSAKRITELQELKP